MEQALAASFILLVAFVVFCFAAWAAFMLLGWFILLVFKSAENAELADRYRALQQKEIEIQKPPQGGYILTYKSGKKVLTTQVVANSEAEAVAQAMKLAIPFDKILGVTKN
jgi:hypothetical protein